MPAPHWPDSQIWIGPLPSKSPAYLPNVKFNKRSFGMAVRHHEIGQTRIRARSGEKEPNCLICKNPSLDPEKRASREEKEASQISSRPSSFYLLLLPTSALRTNAFMAE